MKMQFNLPAPVERIMGRIKESGYESYVVGGAVRDLLSGFKPADYDLVTNAHTEELRHIFSGYRLIDTGLKHGTVTVLESGMPIEVTVYRDSEECTLLGDLRKRDFTINAMAYCKETGVIDPINGINDLKNHLIRAVDDPISRFTEDPLRLLRALRLASVLGFDIEEKTDRAIHDMSALIRTVAIERITDEMTKMICGDHFKRILSVHGDIIHEVIPEISDDELFMKTLEIMGYVESEMVLRLTALFINLINDKNGNADIEKILGRLRIPNEVTEKVKALIRNFNFPINMKRAELMRLINEVGFELTLDLISLKKAYVKVWESGNMRCLDSLAEMIGLVKTIKSNNSFVNLQSLHVNGDDLISMGIKQGKRIKEILDFLLDGVIEGRFDNSHDELIERVKEYESTSDTGEADIKGE